MPLVAGRLVKHLHLFKYYTYPPCANGTAADKLLGLALTLIVIFNFLRNYRQLIGRQKLE